MFSYVISVSTAQCHESRNHVAPGHYSNSINKHCIWPTTSTNKHQAFKVIKFTFFGGERVLLHMLSVGSKMLQWKEYNFTYNLNLSSIAYLAKWSLATYFMS